MFDYKSNCHTEHCQQFSGKKNKIKQFDWFLFWLWSTFNQIFLVTTTTSCFRGWLTFAQTMMVLFIIEFLYALMFKSERGKCRLRFDLAISRPMNLGKCYGTPFRNSSTVDSLLHATFDIYRSR